MGEIILDLSENILEEQKDRELAPGLVFGGVSGKYFSNDLMPIL